MFVGVAETDVGSLLCFDVGVVQCFFIFFFFLFFVYNVISRLHLPRHQETTPESLKARPQRNMIKILFIQKEKTKKRKENPNSTMKHDSSVIKRQK